MFKSTITDFTKDLTLVYPEYNRFWSKWQTATDEDFDKLHAYCAKIYPERFFDIINSNADIFAAESTCNVNFLPGVDFKTLFNCDGVSDNTKQSIWKYLQLILFHVVGSLKDSSMFGDTTNMFESMNEEELQKKMTETFASIEEFFQTKHSEEPSAEEPTEDESSKEPFKMPDLEELHENMKGLLDGKIGKLAQEFSEEFMQEMQEYLGDFDTSKVKSSKDIIMRLMKNPQKMKVIFEKLIHKLKDKMQNGDISQQELMEEMGGLMEKMQKMGMGKGDMASMLQNMKDMPFMKIIEKMLGKNAKIDTNALARMNAQSATKERLRKKLEERQQQQQIVVESAGDNHYVVHIGDEKQEKSMAPPTKKSKKSKK